MYDVAIIGAGAAGIACSKSAMENGLNTVLIEINKSAFGGTCLNKGCIPTKFLLNSSKKQKTWKDSFIEKNEIVEKIKEPLFKFLESKGVDIILDKCSFLDNKTLDVGGKEVKAKNIIIATGSLPKTIINHPKIIFADDIFTYPLLPDKILIIGAGAIGIEFASMLTNFGKTVTVVEKEKIILPTFDSYFSKRLRMVLQNKGIRIETGKSVSDLDLNDFDMVISAVGRISNIEGLKIENSGVLCDESGWIKTDKLMKTNRDNIYACGDITGKKLLAYTAEYQARICIDNIKGKNREEDYNGLAECVFSVPQMAKVGILEEEAKAKNIKYRAIKSNFLKFSSAYVYDDTDGFIEIILDENDYIIGAGIISNLAGELISLFSLSINNNLKLADIKKCLFIHPTLSEIIPLLAAEG